MAQSTSNCSTDTGSAINALKKQNAELRRHRVAMLLIIERLEAELAVVTTQADSSSSIIAAYQQQLQRCRQVYSQYDALIQQKNAVLAIDDSIIKQLKKENRLLRNRSRALGIALPVAGAGIGAGIVALVLTLRK